MNSFGRPAVSFEILRYAPFGKAQDFQQNDMETIRMTGNGTMGVFQGIIGEIRF